MRLSFFVFALLWVGPAFAKPPTKPTKPAAPAAEPSKQVDGDDDEEDGPQALPPGFSEGPVKVKVGQNAELQVPDKAFFADPDATRKLLEKGGNLTSGRETGSVLTDDAQVIFEFDSVGYVKDDDQDALDADKMLASLREGQEEANAELKKLGRSELEIDRWQVKPHYDPASHNLEWGPVVKNKQTGHETVNYNVRLLGRRGVTEVTLLVSPETLDTQLPWFRDMLKGFTYQQGEDYAAFRSGDKVAEYGLAALVTGGAVAVAAKSGLLGKMFKFIVAGVAALGAGLKRFFTRKQPDDQQNG